MRSNRTRCSAIFPSRNFSTKSGCPRGTPSTLNPCWCVGSLASPLQTTTPGHANLASRCNPTQAGGKVPLLFHTFDLPAWMDIFEWPHRCLLRRSCTSPTLPEAHTMYRSSKYVKSFSHSSSSAPTAVKAGCCPKQKSKGIKGSPCSPPSPWGMVWTSPESSSHKWVEGWPYIALTKGSNCSPSAMCLTPCIIEFLEMRSYARIPSTETTVAFGSRSVKTCRMWATVSQPAFVLRHTGELPPSQRIAEQSFWPLPF